MTPKELYELHKGKKAEAIGITGIICGYEKRRFKNFKDWNYVLIMAIDNDKPNGWYLESTDNNKKIVTHRNNKNGYMWVSASNILTQNIEHNE